MPAGISSKDKLGPRSWCNKKGVRALSFTPNSVNA